MAVAARQAPKMPWDFDVPNDAFWNGLDYQIGRNFLQCYEESEISQMTFDDSLSYDEKLKFLRDILQHTFADEAAKTAPTPLHDTNYKLWVKLMLGFSTIEHYLKNYDEEERIVREMYENGPDGSKNMSALHNLSAVMEQTGRYPEAEHMAREVLPWLEGHELLGEGSPQSLGCMRCLARSTWKQARYTDAEEWIDKCRRTVEAMPGGRFEKYQDDEKKQLEEDVEGLRKWKEEHDALLKG